MGKLLFLVFIGATWGLSVTQLVPGLPGMGLALVGGGLIGMIGSRCYS